MVAIKRVRGDTLNGKSGYRYLSKTWQLMLTLGLVGVFSNIFLYAANLPVVIVLFGGHAKLLEIVAGLISALMYALFYAEHPVDHR